MYISYIVLCDIYIMKLMYVYVQTLIMLLRLGMHTKYINKNKTKTNLFLYFGMNLLERGQKVALIKSL